MRLTDWILLTLHAASSAIEAPTDVRHLHTDPACVKYRAPRPGSRLDRISRGTACTPCMADRAWGRVALPAPESETNQ